MSGRAEFRRQRILEALQTRPRTVRGLTSFTGLSSTSSIHRHLLILEERGLIAPIGGWELTPKGREALEGEPA